MVRLNKVTDSMDTSAKERGEKEDGLPEAWLRAEEEASKTSRPLTPCEEVRRAVRGK